MSEKGQHVGAMASDLNEQNAEREAARLAMKALAPRKAPSGPKYREGDGPVCPEEGDHGRTYVMGSGNLWCPVTQALFGRPAPGTNLPGPKIERARTYVTVEERRGY